MNVGTITLAVSGVGCAIASGVSLVRGKIVNSIQSAWLGMAAINILGAVRGVSSDSQTALMRGTLGLGTGSVGVRGVVQIAHGVKQRQISTIIQGTTQAVAGVIGTALVYSADANMIANAHQAGLVALASLMIGRFGLEEVKQGYIGDGLFKILLGIGGTIGAAYYFYNTCINPPEVPVLDHKHLQFLESHQAEIAEIYRTKEPVGNWTLLGGGKSKKAFIHNELSNMLIKIPNNNDEGFRGGTGLDELRMHHINLERARNIADSYNSIILPKSYLYPIEGKPLILEERLHMVNYDSVPESPEKIEVTRQFDEFQRISKLCDVFLKKNHNAGILADTKPLKVGIIDFDCKEVW